MPKSPKAQVDQKVSDILNSYEGRKTFDEFSDMFYQAGLELDEVIVSGHKIQFSHMTGRGCEHPE